MCRNAIALDEMPPWSARPLSVTAFRIGTLMYGEYAIGSIDAAQLLDALRTDPLVRETNSRDRIAIAWSIVRRRHASRCE